MVCQRALGMAALPWLLAACSTAAPADMVARTIDSHFAGELQLLRTLQLQPSEPLARWQGRYGVYLRDQATGSDFMVRLEPGEGAEVLRDKVLAARAASREFVANQRAALAQLQRAGVQGDFFSLRALSPLYGSMRWSIAVFADPQALHRDADLLDEAVLRAFSEVVHLDPEPMIDIYPASLKPAYAQPLAKGYHGMVEFIRGTPETFMQAQDSWGDAHWRLGAQARPAPYIVSARQPRLRAACYAEIEAMRRHNHLFQRHRIYLEPSRSLLEAYQIPARLQAQGLRQGHTAFVLLDRVQGRMVLRGIVAPEAFDAGDIHAVSGVYAYDYVFATGELRVRPLALPDGVPASP